MKALTSIKFPQLSSLKRTTTEKQHDDINQARLNQNFKTIADAIHELETREPVVQGGGGGSDVLQAVYPVGAVYISTVSTDPATLFGFGTWEQIQNRFLLAAGSTYTAGSTGGAATHTLTGHEMPTHSHGLVRQQWYNSDTVASSGTGSIYSWKSSTGGTTSASYNGITGAVGSGAAHNNMPPYLAVFMWKRTA